MIWLLIILGIMLYVAIGFFIDRLWAETYSEKTHPDIITVVFWPMIFTLAFIYYPCYVWPRALAKSIRDWWDDRKENNHE